MPETQRSTTEYDTVGNTFSVTDFNGDTITYNYDAQNRLVEKRVGETSIASFTYTPIGQLETVTDNRGVTSYSYDELGRLLSRTDPDGQYLASGASIEYGYDAAGNRTSVTTPTGTVEYAFDSQNRLKTVTDDAGVTSYSYDLNGNLIRTKLPNGVVETRTYDELSRLESVSYVKDGTLIASYDYTLDPVGHRRVVEERDGRQVEYEYDDLYRLTREAIADPVNGNRTIEYTYDVVGNRLSRIDSIEGTTTYVYDENDRLLQEELTQDGNVVHTYEYRYDDNGNTIERIEKDGNNNVIGNATYSWDKENRLIGVTTSTGDVISYEYDTDNIRVSSTVNGVTTEYLVDKNRPYAEVLSEYVDDAVAVNYLHGLDLISQERDGSESFYLVDGLGSTRLLTDEGGEVANTYSYDAFGNLVASSGSIENEFLFAGEQYDENLDQYYLRQRYYDAGIGRFTRRDTYEGSSDDPLSLNKYIYAHSNPVIFTDPSGLITKMDLVAAFNVADILLTLVSPDPLSIALLAATPPGVPVGFVKGLNKVFGGISRGPLFARLAQGIARTSNTLESSALATRSFMASKGFKSPFISDEYLQGLKSFLPSRTFNKVVDFVSEGENGLILVEAKSKLTSAQLANSINPGGKMVGTANAIEAVYRTGNQAFPGIEKQIITATDLSNIPTGFSQKFSKVATGVPGEFQIYQNGVPAMPNGIPVFLQQL